MINPFETFQVFNSLKYHFKNKKYDVTKYGYKNKSLNLAAFESTAGKNFYAKLGKEFATRAELIDYIASNLFHDNSLWIADMHSEESKKRYFRFKKFKNAQMYYAMEDFKYLRNKYSSFKESLLQHRIIYEIDSGKINPETYILFDRMCNISDVVKKDIPDMIWDSIELKLKKLGCFVSVESVDFYSQLGYNVKNYVSENT